MSAVNTAVARLPLYVLQQAEAAGLERAKALLAAGLTEEELDDPDARIQVRKNLELWRFILKSNLDPDLGIRFGAALKVRDAGLVGYTMLHSSTLQVALERLVRFARILAERDPPFLQVGSETGEISWRAHPQQELTLQRMLDHQLAAVVGVARELTDNELAPVEIRFPYTLRPPDLTAHRSFFRATLKFGEPVAGVVFRKRDLELEVRAADEELGHYLERYAEEVVASLPPGGSLAEKVERALWAEMKEGRFTLQSVASAVAVSARTLQRRLKEEGTSFAELRATFRRDMALALLKDQRLAIYEVAFLLGYSEPSTFYRAFRRWKNTSPHKYRAAFR